MRRLFLFTFLLYSTSKSLAQVSTVVTVIPQPVQAYVREGKFELKPTTRIHFPQGKADWATVAQYFMGIAQASTGFQLTGIPYQTVPTSLRENGIYFIPDERIEQSEGYQLEIMPLFVAIRARTAAGAFYGAQTLRQMFGPSMGSSTPTKDSAWTAAACIITDYPRFSYRGMHLDVSRHFFPVTFIKRYIDLLATHKFNRFHWHLTDDQGWRIEIKKYPRLHQIGGCREETLVGHATDAPPRFDGKPYCGYYTQEEIREVVEYARQRFITIIPEIEMPGHASAALAAYPELGCTGGPYKVAKTWGVFEDVFCAGNDKTFEFLADVLKEVCALFPGEYIHIGGDECPKTRWKACPKCQKRISTEKLKNEDQLQSYFIRRISEIVARYGKKIIGWDEILEGGLPAGATVMSWRGNDGGIAATKAGQYAIMCPTSHCYFDYYQSDPAQEPLAIGGFLTVQRVYDYEPVPASLTAEEARFILGAQGNVWTEYISTPEQVEYMAFPRACALSEVLWTPANKRAPGDFMRRLRNHFRFLENMGVNYARSYYDVKATFNGGYVSLSTADAQAQIKYTLDGSDPKPTSPGMYSPIPLSKTTTLKAAALVDGKFPGRILTVRYVVHKALNKPYTLSTQPSQYSGGEKYALTNGSIGALRSWYHWVGLQDADFDPVIDLETITPIQKISVNFLVGTGYLIYPPRSIEVFTSNDGENFASVGKREIPVNELVGNRIENVSFNLNGIGARYVKLVAQRYGPLPGSNEKTWLFLDEIMVE
ncbi:MAG: glycoside hydrolase family 20 protein [Saprospiraceae bacterium]|nr:glycoside hydrolase family 20 protein [Saprospiraceae bacterium]MDW8483609.1 family 20 glycosylhydrolase [Saprospiraceae bacterium]